jgi:Transcriptional antiterminator
MAMKVVKIINNNIISSLDDQNREIVVMGRGLGFGNKPNDVIDETKIEKVFRMDSSGEIKQLENLLSDTSIEVVELVNTIIEKASNQIEDKLQKSIYITLIDHINFAIERKRQNILFSNPLFYDVRRLYKKEYQIGKEAVAHINKVLEVDLPEEEAAAIALHFINARLGAEMPETITITRIVQNTIKIVQYYFSMELIDEMSEADYLVLHVKQLAERILNGRMLEGHDEDLEKMVGAKFPGPSECVKRISDYILKEHGIKITPPEAMDLTIKIERVLTQYESEK